MNLKNELYTILNDIYDDDFSYSSARIEHIKKWREHLKQFMELFYRLEDDYSKNIFLNLLKYNMATAMVEDSSKYFLYSKDKWNSFIKKANNIDYVKNDYILDRIETFILEGYNYKDICCAKKDDYVIDCGAYTGNTAVYFSDRVGERGKVFAFEAMPDTYTQLEENITSLNKNNIHIYNYAVSDKKKILSFTKTATPGSRQVADGKGIEIPALSIDEFVHENNIKHVNFIKMDVEGAELDVLDGCKETCKKFSPVLAVCIYHKVDDFITLPAKILQIDPRYRFYLKHNSQSFAETVLFAIKKDTALNISIEDEELKEVDALLSIFEKIHTNKQKLLKKYLLSLYIEKFTQISSLNLKWKIDIKNFTYAFSPLSRDEKLHYEFLCRPKSIVVCLHLEGNWVKHADVIKEITAACKLSEIKLQQRTSAREECCFEIQDVQDIDKIAQIMNYLVTISLPILKAHNMLSDTIILNNPTIS